MSRNALIRIAAISLTIGLMIAGAEIFTRLVGGKPATFSYSGSFRDRQTDWDVVYGVTSTGLRVTCGGAKNADAKRRIAIIGDSFVFGQGVSDCNTFASRLGTMVSDAQFVNYGMIGIGIDYYQMIARDMIMSDSSDVVVLFYGNDISEVVDKKFLLGTLADTSSAFALLRKVKRAFDIKAFLKKTDTSKSDKVGSEPVLNNISSIMANDPNYFAKVADPGEEELAIFRREFNVLIKRLISIVPRQNIWIAAVPEATTVSPQVRRFVEEQGGRLPPFGVSGTGYKAIRMLATGVGVGFIDLFPKFRELENGGYFPHDLHWSEEGHQLAARLIAEAINARVEP